MDRRKREALKLSQSGRHIEAADLLRQVIAARGKNRASLDDYMMLAGFLFSAGQMAETAATLRQAASRFPDAAVVYENLGVALRRLGETADAIVALETALKLGSRSENVLDALCAALGSLDQMDRAKAYGIKALLAKDAAARAKGLAYPVPKTPPPPIDRAKPGTNIVSFSLWGADPRYVRGALRNADLMPEIYPGWKARFYLDATVPREAVAQLERLSAEVVTRPTPRTF